MEKEELDSLLGRDWGDVWGELPDPDDELDTDNMINEGSPVEPPEETDER